MTPALNALVTALVFSLAPPPALPDGATPVGENFTARLESGQALSKAPYSLVMQKDGNLVLYADARPCWSSNSPGSPGAYARYDKNPANPSAILTVERLEGDPPQLKVIRTYTGQLAPGATAGDVHLDAQGTAWLAATPLGKC
ncbi:hypothetical protein D5S17_33820 [Pseudonocardiaceae bacterium YIM PH 21723]|nr:hypothetical protein D5S17_33820 [Pseudonocardiaceae bacterium YIM PH 21723]